MTIFIDTSAFYAVISANDSNHPAAKSVLIDLFNRFEDLVCTNYILFETFGLIHNRLGIQAVRAFQENVVSFLTVEWINTSLHQSAVAALLIAGEHKLSLVD